MNSTQKTRNGPAGTHIFDRNSGMNILFDEIILDPIKWSVVPRQVSIALTNACDLSCAHCYAPKHRALQRFSKLAQWLIELDENGCLGVGFGGGEPTLHPQFTEICRFAAQETRLAVTATTHAHHLSDRLLDDLAGNLHFVRVSMDGIGVSYEAIRGRSFENLLRRINSLRSIVPFGINFVVNRNTIGDLSAATELAREFGAAEFLLLPQQPVNGVGGIDEATRMALRQWVYSYSSTVPLCINESDSAGLPICNPLRDENGLRAFAHIDASGFLKRSSFDRHGVPIDQMGLVSAIKRLGEIDIEATQ